MGKNKSIFFKIVGAAVAIVIITYLLQQFVTLTVSVPKVRIDIVVESTPSPTVARPTQTGETISSPTTVIPTSTVPEPTVIQPTPSSTPIPTKEIAETSPAKSDSEQREPVAYYPFDGNANDESGNGHHGTVYGATLTSDRFGNQDSAYLFDGRDDYIALPDNLDLVDTDFTLSAWIKPDDYGVISSVSQSCARRILSYRAKTKSDGHPTNSGISFVLNEASGCGGNNLVKVMFIGQDLRYNGITYEYDATDWFLFTVTRESENVIAYVNGVEMSRNAVSPYAVFENPAYPRSVIGAQWSDVGFNFPFDGVIDDVRVYNRALSAAEVEWLYHSTPSSTPTPAKEPIAHYPFDGNANDESGNGHHGTVYGATLTTDRFGNQDSAYLFDGRDDYIDLGNDVIDQDVLSFSVWFKTGRDKYAQTVLGNYVACSYSGAGFILLYYGSEAQDDPRLQLSNGSTKSRKTRIVYHTSMADDRWHHAVGVFDQNEYALYIDNVLIEKQTGVYHSTHENIKIGTADFIGSHCAQGKGSDYDGLIDDVRIYDRTLSEVEIQALYNEGGWTRGPVDSTPPTPRAQVDTMPEPVAYYPFDENANDESGSGHHGTVYGATLTADRFGNQDSAYLFDGLDDYIELPDGMDLVDTEFTISAWIKPDDYGASTPLSQSCYRAIFGHRYRSQSSGDSTNSGLLFALREASGCGGDDYLSLAFFRPDFRANGIGAPGYGVAEWFLYTVTREPEELILYVNGEQVTSKEISALALYENPRHVYSSIGAQRAETWFAFPFDGVIDDVRVYNRALSAAEVERLYQLGQ